METIITLVIAIPLGIVILWKLLDNGVDDGYNVWLSENGDDYVA